MLRLGKVSSLSRICDAVSMEIFQNIQIEDGVGGFIQVDSLLLTARGLVVLDIKEVSGTVFGADEIDEWTVMHQNQRLSFMNPQHTLDYRLIAVRQLARGLSVFGHILFPNEAKFNKGRPKYVILADEFLERYKKPERLELERLLAAYYPYWDKIRDLSGEVRKTIES